MKAKIALYCLSAIFLLFSLSFAEELPIPTYANSVIISIEHSPADFAEVDYIKSRFSFGLYAWLSFSRTTINPDLPWHHDWNDASTGIQSFKDQVNALIAACREKNVRLHVVLCSGIARALPLYREAKQEDIRNCSWYNDNKLASDAQIIDPNVLGKYVFGTFSRYARKMRANIEAKAKAAAVFLKQTMDENPDVLIALSGWGEAEMNFNRVNPERNLQDYFCDYSPFAVLEFRDWICHTGMYDDLTGAYKGQGYAQGGTKYQGEAGLTRFNADFGTTFTTWNLKYYNWSLSDDFDSNPVDDVNNDPNRIPLSQYSHGNMMPSSGPGYIAGGFDPPRSMMTPSAFLNLWNLFRQTMVHNFVKDLARWMSEAGIPSEKWFSHQIPTDYLWGSNPTWPELYGRYYTSASPLWTVDVRPYGSIGGTIYDIKYPPDVFPGEFARTTKYAVPTIGGMTDNWAIMEYDAETYPHGFSVPQSSADLILQQYMNLYNHNVHLINFFMWWDSSGEHRIKGMNKEVALASFIQQIRDKARRTNMSTVFSPPKVVGLSAGYDSSVFAVRLALSGKIWSGHAWNWKDWGDFSHFEVYRAQTPNFMPGAGNLIATTADYSYDDRAILVGATYFYKLRAVNRNQVGGPFSDEISVTVTSPQAPVLYVNKSLVYFGATQGGATTRRERILVANSGQGVINWQATKSASWIEVSPSSGAGNAALEIAVNASGLSAGSRSGTVTVSDPGAFNSPQTITVHLTVYNTGADAAPFGVIDTPVNGSTVYGSVPVTGWALDDIQVSKVQIMRAPHVNDAQGVIGGDGLVYIGDAVFVKGARPDVASAYPAYPRSDTAGWGYMLLTNLMPAGGNGSFRLYAVAEDTNGRRTTLGWKDIVSNNASSTKPFGAIDTPAQGGVVSGRAYVNFGWALTPPPKEIPRDGSTMWVWIDSLPVGKPVYNQFRQDIYDLFPNYINRDGAVGYYYLDTTKLTNAVHTIAWSVVDNAGESQGIGSRYFEVENVGGEVGGAFLGGIYVEDQSGRLRIEVEGKREIEVEELDYVKIKLLGEGGERFVGWGEDKTRPLPVGSTLEEKKGVFHWRIGPGFLGRHVLHFAVCRGNLISQAAEVIITILPKSFEKERIKGRVDVRKIK
ncbi:MAG: Ig-like domain-containing protein [Clostridiales bacterium]|nr:Ig-like domain-containing protein [Clostridiales bacterium]